MSGNSFERIHYEVVSQCAHGRMNVTVLSKGVDEMIPRWSEAEQLNLEASWAK